MKVKLLGALVFSSFAPCTGMPLSSIAVSARHPEENLNHADKREDALWRFGLRFLPSFFQVLSLRLRTPYRIPSFSV